MPRKRCCGFIEREPDYQRFIPEGQKKSQDIELRIEELEAVRLKDLGRMDQNDCAAAMGLSRATFQRILQSARTKVAMALVEGRSIIIKGGNYMIKNRVFECQDCAHKWEVEPCSEGGKHGYEIACPQCGSMKKNKIVEDGVKHACGGGHDHGHDHKHGGGCCGGH
ncbi:DUF134 domain-containing protein [Pelosinus sp. sgz500959]|uniref:DUF134 domain-containing protein n=1 Tax=Pelosinus sp. sgz500959 TaxID=3242472 RepID=UPI003672936F